MRTCVAEATRGTNGLPVSRSEGRGFQAPTVAPRRGFAYFRTANTLVSTESSPRKIITL